MKRDGYGAPKRELAAAQRLPPDARRLAWEAALPEVRTLERELTGFRVKITTTLHDSYGHWDGGMTTCCWHWPERCGAGEQATGGVGVEW